MTEVRQWTIEETFPPICVMGGTLTRTVRDVVEVDEDGRLIRFISREVVSDIYAEGDD